jgi:hypothetical protein
MLIFNNRRQCVRAIVESQLERTSCACSSRVPICKKLKAIIDRLDVEVIERMAKLLVQGA